MEWLRGIDWTAVGAMLSGIGTILGACAVIYAARKGSDTFQQWRRQKHEERRIHLAEQILALAYKLKQVIRSIRSPMMMAGEIVAVEANLREKGVIDDSTPEGAKGFLITAQGTLSRSEQFRDDWNKLVDTMPTAKAIFGDEVEQQLNEFWNQRHEIIAAAQNYARIRDLPTEVREDLIKKEIARKEKLEKVLWFGFGENGADAVAEAVDDAVVTLENLLLPIIRSDTPRGTGI